MAVALEAVAAATEGRLHGDGEFAVERLVHPVEAQRADDLIFLMEARHAAMLAESPVRAAVLPRGSEPPEGALDAWVEVEAPRYALAGLVALFDPGPHAPPGVHPTADVAGDAALGAGVALGPFVSVGPGAEIGAGVRILSHASVGAGARIGPDCLIHAGARVGEGVVLGARVILQAGAVIGADGFSYVTHGPASFEVARRSGDYHGVVNERVRRIGSLGRVELGDDVEVGANSCIDRSNIGATRIGARTKIDNLCQIAHNITIGEDCLISGNTGIAGSTRIGDRVVLGGAAMLADHIEIGDDAVVG
ncbi:MAG: UDP-3-O-(3-hydroxymyristoyl)glucosamine N-acyltransferase, partial [Alphaproteobacteria bacterium]|nr:UDP-3-O-(3-hydroxymyristoyl)glucosamine N-acyltransferase [Alphaproteobacteria bacterium]